MRIPEFLNRDDYLQNPILRRFLKDHRISFVENRADYIREIEAYSERDERSAAEVRDWLLHVIKEGSKEICYKKVRSINEWHRDPVLLEAKIQELYPDCPRETILTYTNTAECMRIPSPVHWNVNQSFWTRHADSWNTTTGTTELTQRCSRSISKPRHETANSGA